MAPPQRGEVIGLDHAIYHHCHRISVLEDMPDSATARQLLTRAADQVRPIMASHKWKVLSLEEFYPPTPNLLGLNTNHGQRVQIRLRSPSNRATFLPYPSILRTLLHELVHNDIGPHNAQFYALLDQITTECEALVARGGDNGVDGG
eukprot:CAMPEP_0198317298 /NCGR_PEP_ID=MMETSP1450-20131203/6816_1 /TAXON_ID=753684 ORGANISM="Madagascaria erythrocladiodes, Strain CCMP3234" /NCGR_SAMPLE_ID=MMETSP1450 /ASSEMBLY_ACC=CAM_ASM_001115 /LENGTH=146 /DNA_ID=CAMNT_0044020487 /DNA_START=88 /DNA_END=524 /DNA_ORIENTATION=-